MSNSQELILQHNKERDISKFKKSFYETYNVKLYIYTPSEKEKQIPIGVFHDCALAALHESHPCYSSIKSLQNRNRLRSYLVYVQVMSYLAHKEGHSKSSIGKFLKRNHATVINSCKMIENGFFSNDKTVQDAYNNTLKHLETYVGIIPENTESQLNSKSSIDPVWNKARDFIKTNN